MLFRSNGDLDVSFTGTGNGDGITWQYSPASAASPTLGYQFLTADGTRRAQALTINRFGNVSIGNQSLNMANLSVQGNAYVATSLSAGTNLVGSNAIIGGPGYFTTVTTSSGITSGSYITLGSTGFFSFDTSGQFLFRHSAQTKGAVMDVATSNGGNAFTFLTKIGRAHV